jgi:hypothetical protein
MLDDNSVDRAGPYEVGGALGAGEELDWRATRRGIVSPSRVHRTSVFVRPAVDNRLSCV